MKFLCGNSDGFDQIRTNLDQFKQIRTNLSIFGPIWANSDKLEQIRTNWINWTKFDQIRPNSDKLSFYIWSLVFSILNFNTVPNFPNPNSCGNDVQNESKSKIIFKSNKIAICLRLNVNSSQFDEQPNQNQSATSKTTTRCFTIAWPSHWLSCHSH